MGRLIDESLLQEKLALIPMEERTFRRTVEELENAPTVEAIPKADYENRLKADVVAILTELSIKIGEIEDGYTEFDEENKRSLTMIPLENVDRLIQQKINSLKEVQNDREKDI